VGRITGFGEPPLGFNTGSTSASEWPAYWALSIIEGTPKDPRRPPFLGGDNWRYQRAFDDGRGGAVIDFVVYTDTEQVGIRIQTFRFHYEVDARKQASDTAQADYLGRFFRIEDVKEGDLIGDLTGASAIRAMKGAVLGINALNPLKAGLTQQIRSG
jgi:hypothetical protein